MPGREAGKTARLPIPGGGHAEFMRDMITRKADAAVWAVAPQCGEVLLRAGRWPPRYLRRRSDGTVEDWQMAVSTGTIHPRPPSRGRWVRHSPAGERATPLPRFLRTR